MASLALTGTLVINTDEANDLDIATRLSKIRKSVDFSLTNGTGASQCNMIFSDTRTLTATSETLDLAGALTGAFGSTLTFTKLKVLYIRNTSTTDNLIVGNATNPVPLFSDASDKYPIPPGGILLITAPNASGIAVTASTGDGIKIDAGSATITYDIVMIGVG